MAEKMRKLTKQEIVAMWLYGEIYARLGMGAITFYKQLSEGRKNVIDDFLKEIKEAT